MNDFGWYADEPMPNAAHSSVGGQSAPVADADTHLELADARRLLRRASRGVARAARKGEHASFRAMLARHFPGGLDDLAVVEESWPAYDHVNVAAGLDAWLAEPGRAHRLLGVASVAHDSFGLADLLAGTQAEMFGPRPGNVSRVNLACGPSGQVRACVQCGLYLVEDGEGRHSALFLRAADPESGHATVTVQVVSDDPAYPSQVCARLRLLALEHNVYRGQVLSFGGDVFGFGQALLTIHERPTMGADRLVLPDDVLAAIQRQVVGLGRHRQRLLDAGQHLKRGLLLFGPPGVGKTHTVRYLLAQLDGVTVVSLTGTSIPLIAEACSIARSLQPSVVVVEDVDLIAEDRGMDAGEHPLLFSLLNEMDGLDEDADIVFVLTTNRADLLEPALAARPGRVDQAVELALPDTGARRALFDLYSRQVDIDTRRLDSVLERTEGVTASFLKELIRRACVLSADADPDSSELHVDADALEAALDELLDTRNAMTRVLLGGLAPQ